MIHGALRIQKLNTNKKPKTTERNIAAQSLVMAIIQEGNDLNVFILNGEIFADDFSKVILVVAHLRVNKLTILGNRCIK